MEKIENYPELMELFDQVGDEMSKKYKDHGQYPESAKELLNLKLTEEFIEAIHNNDGRRIKRYAEMICYIKHCQVMIVNSLFDVMRIENLRVEGKKVLTITGGDIKRLIKENRERED